MIIGGDRERLEESGWIIVTGAPAVGGYKAAGGGSSVAGGSIVAGGSSVAGYSYVGERRRSRRRSSGDRERASSLRLSATMIV